MLAASVISSTIAAIPEFAAITSSRLPRRRPAMITLLPRLRKPAADARTASRDEDRVTGEFHSRILVGASVVWQERGRRTSAGHYRIGPESLRLALDQRHTLMIGGRG